jgi:presenilin-like A22 family membrane protease
MRDRSSILAMATLFVGVQLLAVVLSSILPSDYQAFEDAEDPANPVYYVVMLLIMTALILLLIRFGKGNILKGVFYFAFFTTLIYVFFPLYAQVIDADTAGILAVVSSVTMVSLMALRPEWYVLNTVGFLVAIGVTAIIGISLGILPVIILLVLLAIYDFISVYRTKHMLTLAEGVTKLNLPILFVVPKEKGFKMDAMADGSMKEENRERGALFMGLGDAIIPGALVVSAFNFLDGAGGVVNDADLIVALGTIVGGLLGFLALMRFVLTGRPQAGLPLLNGGAIIGYMVTYLIAYQDLGLGMF